jgi:Zn-dependent protease with chaperone function
MRIPFDLIAAVLCLEGISEYLSRHPGGCLPPVGWGLAAWGGFLLVTWLANELVTRDAEWRTRFGTHVSGVGGGRHPLVVHAWMIGGAQGLSVLLYAGILWFYRWPLWVDQWPVALGLDAKAHVGELALRNSALVVIPLNLAPFLLGMLASWIPRRRLASRLRGRRIPLWTYLGYEARLTWLPVALGIILATVKDAAAILPSQYTAWVDRPGIDLVVVVASIAMISLVILPKLIIWLWRCRPLPEGELKERLWALVRRSGVRARDILVWGPHGSGLLNACVLGSWPRYRYVLISPALVEELGMEETEAVLGHELGHARYGHLLFLFMMILCLSALLDPVLSALPASWRKTPLVEIGVTLGFISGYMYLFYGTIMRQCEREADLASAELMGSPAPLVSALEKLAEITGNIRNVWCWHHGSIAQRVAAVERLSQDEAAGKQLHARLRRVRIMFAVLTAVALAAQMWVRLNR